MKVCPYVPALVTVQLISIVYSYNIKNIMKGKKTLSGSAYNQVVNAIHKHECLVWYYLTLLNKVCIKTTTKI